MKNTYISDLTSIVETLEKMILFKDILMKGEKDEIVKELILSDIIICSKKAKKAYNYLDKIHSKNDIETLDDIHDIKLFISIEKSIKK